MALDDWRDRLREDLSQVERARKPESSSAPTVDDTPAPPRSESLPNIPRYEISALIGEGAGGVVYRAEDRELRRPVALKTLRHGPYTSENARQRFRREAKMAASITHPNVVAMYDTGEEAGVVYLVMELVEGRPLSALLREPKPPLKDLVVLLEKAARGVGAAHDKGIVHRDLKPGNILVTPSSEPKVADFGLARPVDSSTELTQPGHALGTPHYMSPEQVQGRLTDMTPRTDVYCLGVILYEILTGQPPHQGDSPTEIYGKILSDEPTGPSSLNPNSPRDLGTIALKALEKDPARRYETASAFADDLRRHLDGEPIVARSVGPAYRLYRRWRRNRLAYGFAAGMVLAAGAAGSVWLASRQETRRLEAERDKSLNLLREYVRVSLDATLKLRRAGANAAMREFVPGLEAAYQQALLGAPHVAEIEYLMGRMYRVLMEDAKATEFQERALQKDPRYAPAQYELAILLTSEYGAGLTRAMAQAWEFPSGPVTPRAVNELPAPVLEKVETSQNQLVTLRERILKACTAIETAVAGRKGVGLQHVTEAHLQTVKGLLAYHRKEYDKARDLLEAVVRKEPTLEEAWAGLGMTVFRQALLAESQPENLLKLHDEAEQVWTRAIENDIGYVPHWNGRAEVRRRRGSFLARVGEDPMPFFRAAEADFTRMLELTSNLSDAWLRRGAIRNLMAETRMKSGQDPTAEFDGAEQDLSHGIDRSPENTKLWTARANVRIQRAQYLSSSKQDPTSQFVTAEQDLAVAVRLTPRWAYLWSRIGTLNMFRGNDMKRRGDNPLAEYDKGDRAFTEALRLDRNFIAAWSRRGRLRNEKGSYREERGDDGLDDLLAAEEDLSQAARINGNPFVWTARGSARVNLGRHYDRRKNPEKAVEYYKAAVVDFGLAEETGHKLDTRLAADLAAAQKRLAVLRTKR